MRRYPMTNVFTKEKEEYVRNLNFVEEAKHDLAFYLSHETGENIDVCYEFINREWSESGAFPMEDPPALVLAKNKPGHREKEVIPLQRYFQDITDNKYIVSPTLVTYYNPEQQLSLLSEYTDNNVKLRSQDKKDMFKAKIAKNFELAKIKNDMQNSRKIKNNGM